MTVKAELLKKDKHNTLETVSDALMTKAAAGNIDAMALLSFMEYNGICVEEDKVNAIKRLRLCAKWNNVFGNLLGIAYDPENRDVYMGILSTVYKSANHRSAFEHIQQHVGYDSAVARNPIAEIIRDAINLGVINASTYDRIFAKVAFSTIISVEDKKKLLLIKQKEIIDSLADVPFDVATDKMILFNNSRIKNIPIKRERELKKIAQNLTIAQRCCSDAYSPLLVVASDEYIADMYCNMFKECFEGTPIIEIDASALSVQDFVGSKENVLIRGLSETKNAHTVFLLTNCDGIDDSVKGELLKVLDYEYRKKYKLFSPAVSFDLSGLVFVLLASARNSDIAELSEYCDTVWAERISGEEKLLVVESIFDQRCKSFGLSHLKLDEKCKAQLALYDVNQLQQIIDGVLRIAIYEELNCVTPEQISEVCKEHNITAPKNRFGFIGGYCDA